MSTRSRGIVFPYAIALRGDGAVHVVPVAAIDIKAKSGEWFGFSLIIDSGASVSVLPKHDAELLDVRPASGKATMIQGVGGTQLRGWEHKLTIRCGSDTFRCPIVFLDTANAPRILGRFGVFDRYTIIFEEYARRTGLFPHRTARQAVTPLFREND